MKGSCITGAGTREIMIEPFGYAISRSRSLRPSACRAGLAERAP